jgi:hypothetical protein
MNGRNLVTTLAAAFLLVAGLVSSGAQGAGDAELQAARQELRLRAETERRMRRDFESLLGEGRMSAAEVADFEDYLRSLAMMVDEQRNTVAKLEGTAARGAAGAGRAPPLPADFDRGQTDAEKIALLDAQLGSSLSEFDEKLLREQKELAEKSRSASSSEGAGDAGSGDGASGKAGEGQGEKAGGEAAGDGSGAGAEKSGKAGQQNEPGGKVEAGGGSAEGNDQVASAGGANDAGSHTGKSTPPADIPDGKDDDIVARQLREAAETEQDPELREKLWEEYRKYKNRTR